MNPRRPSAFVVIVLTFAFGAVPGVLSYLFAPGTTVAGLVRSALIGSLFSVLIGTPCWIVAPRVYCRLETRPMWMRMTGVLGLFSIALLGGTLAGTAVLVAFRLIPASEFRSEFLGDLKISGLITFSLGLAALMISVLLARLEDTKERLHQRELAAERAQKMTVEARFASLESRVHPHFLFNTLNSISALVREDPAEAERTIERLAQLLRFSLDTEPGGIVELRHELRIVEDYLEIEKVRFGSRLRYRIELDDEAGSRPVPALSVQTLVENSVKYAVGARRNGAEIVISARLISGKLRIEVADDGPGFEPSKSLKPGHGIDLLQRRLSAMFGSGAALEISAENGRTLLAMSFAA